MDTTDEHVPAPRPARRGDIPGIVALVANVFAEYGLALDVQRDEPKLLIADTHFAESGGAFWVVESDGRVRATGAVYLHAEAAELKSLYVHPSIRRRGVASRLTQLAIDRARSAGCRRMFLWSDTRLHAAHRLYRALGFAEFGLRVLADSHHSREIGFERMI